MDNALEYKVSSLAHAINENVRNREFGYVHETINESIEQWKKKAHYDMLCHEAQIMVELMSCDRVFSGCLNS
ncbi:MAG: hypothetical protein D8M57_09020 [Candidatus Scalindua sp. AMX11]|nr:MAG: hypothetical protein DWQ00_00750 [Candidatus Scalindua sp.]NOG83064.1 hypothetical protein [Planctomycetota bacterium]RZV79539.1 MAG: hypothetical protein EX341_10905 [Candidatus Scalindua sp. SCAELEC01]TDE65175.1 MAG: hypothetical protein D8M57_09020 [Candidatus Scalindua sp. AMX11]GJQ58588.1 MAG: hypothetical protein SCALA701_13890 [Candidatus Scalindua sp.]